MSEILRELAMAKVAFQLRAIEVIIRSPASVDTHAKRGDAKQAPSPMGSAVDAEGSETPKPPQSHQ